MIEKTHSTDCGDIHYWLSEPIVHDRVTLVMLPGLTADHRLFDLQIAHFEHRTNLLTWDAPGHASSWLFRMEFSLMDKARWLDEILDKEGIQKPLIVGQSMGGYVGQAYAQLFPDKLCGFISIDSAPLQRRFITSAELWLLRNVEPIYRIYPWKTLIKAGSEGVATTDYGRTLMRDMMMDYGDTDRYATLVGHGYRMLAEAIQADLPYRIKCPALLVCGDKDRAGSTKRYNKAWHKATAIPLRWIHGAGHNSNTDDPSTVNRLIDEFIYRNFDTTSRDDALGLWMTSPMPMVTLVKTIDVTQVLRYARRHRLSLNMLLCWCIGRAASHIPEFRLLPTGNTLRRYTHLGINVIVSNDKGGINSCDIPFDNDLGRFSEEYRQQTRKAAAECQSHFRDDLMIIGTSAMIGTEIDCVVNQYTEKFKNPMLMWGKCRKTLFHTTLPISFQFHHVQMDGGHAAQFLETLSAITRAIADQTE